MVAITLFILFDGFGFFFYYNSMRDKLVNLLVFTSRKVCTKLHSTTIYVLA